MTGGRVAAVATPARTRTTSGFILTLLTRQLENLISVAVKDKDKSLTMRKCLEMLASLFGEQRVTEHREYISAEVSRIARELTQMEKKALVEFVRACHGVTEEEVTNYSSYETGLCPFHSSC